MHHDKVFLKKVKSEKLIPLPASTITPFPEISGKNNACKTKFHIVQRYFVPTGMSSWVNAFIIFRQEKPSTGELFRPKISLRKYQNTGKEWKKRNCFNINSEREAAAIVKLIQSVYPQAMNVLV